MRILSFFMAGLLVLSVSSVSFASGLVLIVNKANPLKILTKHDAKRIFLGKKMTWPNRNLITTVTQSNSKVHKHFVHTIMHQTSQEYDAHWRQLALTGRGIPPKSVFTDAEVKAFVSANVNAIGYINARSLDKTVKRLKMY